MATIQVKVKHVKEKYDVEVLLDEPVEVLKTQLFALTGVPPERQKITAGIKQITDDTDLKTAGLKPNQVLMLIGTADVLAAAEKVVFIEDIAASEMHGLIAAGVPFGLENLGNTCYMNSTFQMLANVEPLVRKMASHPPAASVLDPATELAKSARNLFFSLKRAHEPVAPHEFLNSLRTSFPQFAQRGENGGWAQQDAEECLTQIMQVLSSKVKEDGKSVVEDLFGIEMDIEVKATEGDEPAYTEKEKVLKMACHIEGPVMQPDGSNKGGTDLLPQCIAKAMVSQLEKTSPVLGRQVIYNKTAKITKLPPYLLCQFVRFYWKQDTQKKAKILRPVKFPVTLDMKDYCTDPLKASIEEWREVELKKQEAEKLAKRFKNFGGDEAAPAAAGAAGGEAAKAGEAMEVEGAAAAGAPAAGAGAAAPAAPAAAAGNVEDKWGSYELTGVLTHQGRSADGGHYISWIKKEGASKEASQTWYKFDDDKVSEVDEKKVKELYGGGDWHMAYICLYKKCDTVFGSDSTRY
mmetsp:Transcript_48425/g.115238  ORF Transcript_48425/g.115238 Transcript_48425/m.115238 type:complete len:521 (-) Transcript_48425:159-1721(-)|eukprot:CAMPEP_0180132674 /NCGR_PEP_ID=MMETSP0986-20121125/9117_1 /TAXON_ID=697907 /ORGANISM="non described non described, Strain CCMP2293" /LENGTH=520 /DNA_ID=CAMNT_0022072709 /DNA_START=47 /DNA_END=1609 /DNA_ORIENTATION=+